MKRLFTLLLISFAALSCEMGDKKLDDLLDKRDWVIFDEGTELTVDVPSKHTVLNYKFETTLDWEVKSNGTGLDMEQECRNRKKEKVEDSNYNRSNLISNLKALR